MNTNKSIIKTCTKIIVLLLLIMSISNVSYAATYSGTSGVEEVVKSNPSDIINKTIFLKYSDLKESNYLYCLEQGQKMKDAGSDYTVSEYIEIDGEKATAMYKPSGKDWHYFNNENQYNAILALILNSEGQLGHGSSATDAQKALWSYFPYWIQHSGLTLGTDNSWCSGSNWSDEYDGGSTGKQYLEKAMQAYANGERAKIKIYLLHNLNGTESWQRLMIAIPEGTTIEKDNDLVIKKVDKDTGETLSGVQFTVRNDENKYIQASGPDANNVYIFTGHTTDESKATKFRTGTNNYKEITIQNIPDDKYIIKEVYNPYAEYEANVGTEYSVDKTDNGNDKPCIIEIKNTKSEKIIIDKVDEKTQKPLGGVEFIIRNDKKKFIKASGPNSKNEYTFTGYTQNGNEATTFKTGTVSSYKTITIIGVPNDTYIIKEMYNPILGYESNELREWQIVKEDSKTNQDFTITLTNRRNDEDYKPKRTTVVGKVTITGFVWEEIVDTKNNQINSQYDNDDLRVKGIKVYWKDSAGNIIAETKTDENGAYKFSENLEFYNHPFEIKDVNKFERIKGSYVEFDYNGIKYTTVANTSDLRMENKSQGVEDKNDRNAIDEMFATMPNEQLAGIVTNSDDSITELNYFEKSAVTATTSMIKNWLSIAEGQEGWTKMTTFCTEHCDAGIREHEVGRINLTEGESSATIVIYCNGRARVEKWNDAEGILDDKINSYINTPIGNEFNKYNSHYYSAGEIDGPANRDCLNGEEKIYEWNIKNVNLGLVRREQPDIAITSDIEKVRVIMKNQEYTYIYGNRGIQDPDKSFDYKVQWQDKYLEQVYSRPINPADIAYVNKNDTEDLKVYVTYNIRARNESNTLYMTANNIVNYYDSNYTIYTGEGSATSEGWTPENGETKNGYKVTYNSSFKEVKLAPGAKTDILKIEFEVNQETIKGLLNEDAPLKNVSEVVSYTTYYGENTRCAEDKFAKGEGKVGNLYAGIDSDSIAGNAVPGNVETYEDDTDRAPAFLLHKDSEDPDPDPDPDPDSELKYKVISGTVWEDSQTDESASKNERLGNGVKADSENGVANVKVELLLAETGEIAKLYRIKDIDENGDGNLDIEISDAVTYTDSEGNYSFGNNSTDGTTLREGVVTGKYIIKYTYGNDTTILEKGETNIGGSVINARNYKSTIITDDSVRKAREDDTNSEIKWHLTTLDNTSVAVDDLEERLAIPSLQYKNYEEPVNMIACSKPFELQIEYTEKQESNVDENGEKLNDEFKHDWPIFDFGIIERPREDIVVDKTISYIKLTLGNGQVLIDGDPREGTLNYAKAIGFKNVINNRDKALSALDKILSIEMDTELIQGSTLNVTYAVTVTNNSEIDYEYDTDIVEYYYYGENPTNVITQSVELLVDYLDSELACEVGENAKSESNKKWKSVTAEDLKDNGYISFKKSEDEDDKTYETLKNGNYTILVTDAFKDLAPSGGSQTEYLSVSKILANKEENSIEDSNAFDNHIEILKLNGKTARTIESTNNGQQKAKTYKPGNYIPSFANRTTNLDDEKLEIAGLHQPDDDRVRVVITPPTGISNYITIYIIAAVVALIVIVGGIIFIKRKVIIK